MDVFTAFAKGFVEGFIIQSLWNHIKRIRELTIQAREVQILTIQIVR